jgi:methyl-accepting chemotaxis protein
MKKIHVSVFLKIWLSIGILILGYLLSIVIINNTGKRLKQELTYLESVVFPAAIISQNMLSDFQNQVKQYEDAIVMGEANLLEQASETSKSIQAKIQRILSLQGWHNDDKDKLSEILKQSDEFTKTASVIYKSIMGKEVSEIKEDKQRQLGDLAKKKELLSSNMTNLSNGFSDELRSRIKSSLIFFGDQQRFNIIIFVIVLVVSVFIIWFVTKRTIIKPIEFAISKLIQSGDIVSKTSADMSANSRSLSEGTNEQAANIGEVSSATEEFTNMVRKNTDNANHAKSMTSQSVRIVSEVSTHMAQLEDAMNKITESTQKAEKVIKLINEISFQTNLLALNAAIEAARAGEAGAGFAIVAGEVRNLAARASDASNDTSQLIDLITSTVANGNELSKATMLKFQENVSVSEAISRVAEEILASSNEQATGIHEINRSIAEISRVIQMNSANAETSAEAAQELEQQVGIMSDIVIQLKNTFRGESV